MLGKSMVSEQFKRAFYIVAEHYGCSQAEINLMKSLARAKYAEAEPSYLAMAREINPAFGINERLKDIEVDKIVEENKRLDELTPYERAMEQMAKLKRTKK
jgi:stalled ribosome rescue protein Dom34